MAKKKKVVVADSTCAHCGVEFAIAIAWCTRCLDHHSKDNMKPGTTECKRCASGLNKAYLKKRAARPEYVPAPAESYGPSTTIEAYEAWVASPAYKHRFDTLGVTPTVAGSDAERDAIEHDGWISRHFGL